MTDLKFTSPSGETTIKLEGTGRLGTVTPKIQLHIHGVTDKEEIDRMAKQLVDNAVKEVKMTEIEEVKAQIKVLQSKLSFLEELEKTPSPAEEAYKDWWGEYPTNIFNSDDVRWMGFQAGYNAAYEEKVAQEPEEQKWDAVRESVKWCEENPDKDPLDWLKPQTPKQVEQGLKEAFREAVKQGVVSKVNKPTDELIDKLTKNPPEFLKFELGQSLYDLIADWWDEIFVNGNPSGQNIESLVDHIQFWLPSEQSAAGSQSLGVEDMVEGFNDCLKKIKRKLR